MKTTRELQELYPVYSSIHTLLVTLKRNGFKPVKEEHVPYVLYYWSDEVEKWLNLKLEIKNLKEN